MENPFEIINKRLSNIESLLLDIKHGELKPKLVPKEETSLRDLNISVRLYNLITDYGRAYSIELETAKDLLQIDLKLFSRLRSCGKLYTAKLKTIQDSLKNLQK